MQNHYNLVYREEEREMFPTLNLFKVCVPFSSIAMCKLRLAFAENRSAQFPSPLSHAAS